MILVGQFDSPFVRRVGIALTLYGMPFEHRPWSTFGDKDAIAQFNPLTRVPTLVLDDGTVLIESAAILDWLDECAGPERALIPRSGLGRRDALKVCCLAMGLAEKAVSLVYERALHPVVSTAWVERCEGQVAAVLAILEAQCPERSGDYWWFGPALSHADIAVGCALRFLGDAHPALLVGERVPRLVAFSAACEALPAFAAVQQPFIPPA